MADGKIENIEFDYILSLAEKCYMDKSEVQRVLDNPGEIRFYPPKTLRERFDQIYDLITVMLVDGEIHHRELSLCKAFAIRLGFRPAIVDDLIRRIIDKAIEGLAAEAALKELSEIL
jgi:hypothetical protein